MTGKTEAKGDRSEIYTQQHYSFLFHYILISFSTVAYIRESARQYRVYGFRQPRRPEVNRLMVAATTQ